jgi:hypothetical protein
MGKLLASLLALLLPAAVRAAPESGVAKNLGTARAKPVKARTNKTSGGSRRAVIIEEAAAAVEDEAVEEAAPPPAPKQTFTECMDGFCKSPMFPDKGRCRCSPNLIRIEKSLRDIERQQAEADKSAKALEIAMNVDDVLAVENAVSSAYDNINSIEKSAKVSAALRIDERTHVPEGVSLFNEAVKLCASAMETPEDKAMKPKEYQVAVEKDCGSFSTILKEKQDSVANLLIQTQKNQEMFDETENKKRNLLDTDTCRVEYQACAKNECGEDWKVCREMYQIDNAVKRCEAVNKGKCEDTKALVLRDLRNFIYGEVQRVKNYEAGKKK